MVMTSRGSITALPTCVTPGNVGLSSNYAKFHGILSFYQIADQLFFQTSNDFSIPAAFRFPEYMWSNTLNLPSISHSMLAEDTQRISLNAIGAKQFCSLKLPSSLRDNPKECTRRNTPKLPSVTQLSCLKLSGTPQSTLNSRATEYNLHRLHRPGISVTQSARHRVQTGTIPRFTTQRNVLAKNIRIKD